MAVAESRPRVELPFDDPDSKWYDTHQVLGEGSPADTVEFCMRDALLGQSEVTPTLVIGGLGTTAYNVQTTVRALREYPLVGVHFKLLGTTAVEIEANIVSSLTAVTHAANVLMDKKPNSPIDVAGYSIGACIVGKAAISGFGLARDFTLAAAVFYNNERLGKELVDQAAGFSKLLRESVRINYPKRPKKPSGIRVVQYPKGPENLCSLKGPEEPVELGVILPRSDLPCSHPGISFDDARSWIPYAIQYEMADVDDTLARSGHLLVVAAAEEDIITPLEVVRETLDRRLLAHLMLRVKGGHSSLGLRVGREQLRQSVGKTAEKRSKLLAEMS